MPFSRLRPRHAQGQAQTHKYSASLEIAIFDKDLFTMTKNSRSPRKRAATGNLFWKPQNNERPIIPTKKIGGGERARTDDLLLAKQVLSQLSYAPSGKKHDP